MFFQVLKRELPKEVFLSSAKIIWEKKTSPDSVRFRLLRNTAQFIGDIKAICG